MTEGDMLTLAEAAESLGVTDATLRQAVARGALAAEKMGARLWVTTRAEVERYRVENLGRRGPRKGSKREPL